MDNAELGLMLGARAEDKLTEFMEIAERLAKEAIMNSADIARHTAAFEAAGGRVQQVNTPPINARAQNLDWFRERFSTGLSSVDICALKGYFPPNA